MSVALLDVNALLALHWRSHKFHNAAMKWFAANGKNGWATCALTQVGFTRVLSNPSFDAAAPPPAKALELLANSTTSNPNHQFWPDTLPLSGIGSTLRKRIQGHNQLVDAYLLALAMQHHGYVATFDSRMQSLAPQGSPEHDALVILHP